MTATGIHVGQSRVVGFLAVVCVLAGYGVIRGILGGNRFDLFFPLAQGVFAVLAGVAAWYLYQSKKVGWYLSVLVALNWFIGLSKMKIFWNLFVLLVTLGMAAVLIWLVLPGVRSHFGLEF
jgi:hypothetical protein